MSTDQEGNLPVDPRLQETSQTPQQDEDNLSIYLELRSELDLPFGQTILPVQESRGKKTATAVHHLDERLLTNPSGLEKILDTRPLRSLSTKEDDLASSTSLLDQLLAWIQDYEKVISKVSSASDEGPPASSRQRLADAAHWSIDVLLGKSHQSQQIQECQQIQRSQQESNKALLAATLILAEQSIGVEAKLGCAEGRVKALTETRDDLLQKLREAHKHREEIEHDILTKMYDDSLQKLNKSHEKREELERQLNPDRGYLSRTVIYLEFFCRGMKHRVSKQHSLSDAERQWSNMFDKRFLFIIEKIFDKCGAMLYRPNKDDDFMPKGASLDQAINFHLLEGEPIENFEAKKSAKEAVNEKKTETGEGPKKNHTTNSAAEEQIRAEVASPPATKSTVSQKQAEDVTVQAEAPINQEPKDVKQSSKPRSKNARRSTGVETSKDPDQRRSSLDTPTMPFKEEWMTNEQRQSRIRKMEDELVAKGVLKRQTEKLAKKLAKSKGNDADHDSDGESDTVRKGRLSDLKAFKLL